jgi:hypothetical protein
MDSETTDPVVPEVKIPVAYDPDGVVRFELSEPQADQLYEHIRSELERAIGDNDGAISIQFSMGEETFADAHDGVAKLQDRLPKMGVKQVPLSPDPAVAISMLIDNVHMADLLKASEEMLESEEVTERYSQQFQVTQTSAFVGLRQLEAALDGAERPADEIDMDAVSEEYEEWVERNGG